MPHERSSDRSTILRSFPILISLLLGDFVLFRLLPGVDTGAGRTLRYAPLLGLSAGLFVLGIVLSHRSIRDLGSSGPAPEAGTPPASALSRMYLGILVAGLAGSVFFAYLVGKVLVFRLDHESVWKDTVTYAAVAEAPISSSKFWAGQRSFTLPLIYKALDVDQTSLAVLSKTRLVGAFQFILGVLSWTTLAVVVAGIIKNRVLKLVGFGVILAFAMTLDVSLWDRVLLSESIATSLLALIVSFALLGVRFRDRLGPHGSWWQSLYWLGFVILIILYSFTRDTNAYFLAACAVVILASMAFRQVRGHVSAPAWILFSIFLLALSFVQSNNADQGGRWVSPYYDVLQMRIFPDAVSRSYFQAAGMPADGATTAILLLGRRGFFRALESNPAAQPLTAWVQAQGRSTYMRYLLSHPVETFMGPMNRARNLVSPVSTEYRADDYSIPVWLTIFSRFFFPLPLGIVLAWVGAIIVALYLTGRRRKPRAEWSVPAILLLTAVPLMYVVWYGDAIEVERHAFQISLQIRLGLWMLTVFLADAWLATRLTPSAEAAV
jgi:hypothetical protein